ncbi:MBL fold metallo-hydrolase [Denitrobaculum tricleocarpae]|uniref:MBL fold metallo-hydrolase n=1 Tax=Denitrobaculum tricleocarpae TaxID=2591009 RepID=UPI0015D3295D|nr:MBL fold metallo-hydrolase [Denitrobaculum tricleocarpae]
MREVLPIRDGIWRTREDRHFGLLIETDEGMIVFDTLNPDFAGWLNAEIKNRFNKPVSWVVYSHNHADHVSGGQAFEEHSPRYLSHAFARESMERMGVNTRLPDMTFDNGFDLRLGSRLVELRYHGPNDGRGSISLRVPDQRLLSAVDWLVINRMPYRDLARYDVEGTIRSLYAIDAMDWEIASPGHADTGGKAEARIERRYLEALRDGVAEGIASKRNIEEVVRTLRAGLAAVPEFAALRQFDDWVELNIRGTHHQIARIEGFMDG